MNVEVRTLEGTLITAISIDIGRSKDAAWLLGQIAASVCTPKGEIGVITSQGAILEQTPAVLLSTCL